MNDSVCPKCSSSNVADVIYGYIEPGSGGLPGGRVAGGCAVDPTIKWRCQGCGFEWAPVDTLREFARNSEKEYLRAEEEYWCGADLCLSLKEAEQGESLRLSKIKKKILERNELSLDEVEMLEFNTSTSSLDLIMNANRYVCEEYEKQLAQIREGKLIDADEETLKLRYEATSNVSKLWEAMTDSERSAVRGFKVYCPDHLMARIKELKYKIGILEKGRY